MITSKFKYAVVIVILLLAQVASAQVFKDWQWGDETEIYNDGITHVSITFFRAVTSCETGGKSNRFRFNISGALNPGSKATDVKLDYLNCEGRTITMIETLNIGQSGQLGNVESIDYRFTGSAVLSVNNMTIGSVGLRIYGPQSLCSGQSISLSTKVIGLADSLRYQWQEGSGEDRWNNIDSANSTVYNTPPISGKKYFRCVAVQPNDSTGAKIISNVLVVNVFNPVITITGANHVCSGGKAKFSASISTIEIPGKYQWQKSADNAKWVDLVGDTLNNYTTPALTAESYYRCIYTPAPNGCSQAISNAIKVVILNIPRVAIAGETNICEGASASLTATVTGEVTGGYQWQTSSDNRNWNSLDGATSNKLYSPPLNQTTYFRARYKLNEDGCLAVLSNAITVTTLAAPPISVSKSKSVREGRRVVIYAKALTKTADGHYHWLSSTNQYFGWSDIPGATDPRLKTGKIMFPMYYRCVYKSKDNQCEATSAIVTIGLKQSGVSGSAGKKSAGKWSDRYNTNKKFVEVGFGVGAEFFQNPFTASHTNTQTSGINSITTNNAQVLTQNALGLRGDFFLHPYIKDFLSLGLNVGGAFGTSPGAIGDVFSNTSSTGAVSSESFLYSRLNFGLELALGSPAVKVLFKYKDGIQTNNFSRSVTSDGTAYYVTGNTTDQYNFNEQFRRETISGGFRFGAYSTMHTHLKRPLSFDMLFNLARDYNWNWQSPTWNYTPVSDWRMGLGLGLWVQSAVKIDFDMNFDANSFISTPGQPQSGTTFQISLIYNRNWFH